MPSESYSYNNDGGFVAKNRAGNNLSYTYFDGTNRLQKVIKNGTEINYTSDAKGNISGGYGKLQEYNYQNLPLEMLNAESKLYKYSYNPGGKRIEKSNQSSGGGEYYLNDYLGREFIIYDKTTGNPKEVNIYGNGLVGKIMIEDNEATGYYYTKDHLGSVRVVMSDAGNITAAQDYYPYGELLRENNSASQRYQFTEKEKDNESSYLHFDARTLDPNLPMWLQVDPLAEKYPGWSPYNYTLCNPLKFVDPKGMLPIKYTVNGIEMDYDTWNSMAEPLVKDGGKKEKEIKIEEENKKKQNQPNKKHNVISVNADVCGSFVGGFNFALGFFIDPNTSDAFAYFKWGMSGGFALSIGLEASTTNVGSFDEARGTGSIFYSDGNTNELDLGIGVFNPSLNLDSKRNGCSILGGGWGLGAGGGASINSTFQTWATPTFNIIKTINDFKNYLHKNGLNKPLNYYR